MIGRASAGDRIILFTLVDLLVQIIFCGFLLFAVNRAFEGKIQDKLAALARAFGVVSVTSFLDATSKLVAIADLGKVDTVSVSDRSTETFTDLTKVLGSMDREDLALLAAADPTQRRAFLRHLLKDLNSATSSSSDLKMITAVWQLIKENGLTPADLINVAHEYRVMDPKRRKLEGMYASMSPDQRAKLLASAQELSIPKCFDGRPAFKSVEVSGGYYVSDPIRDVSGPFSRAVANLARSGDAYFVPSSLVDAFGQGVTSEFQCKMRVLNRSETNDLLQYQRLNQYFLLE